MPYQVIQPPFSLKFREMPKEELVDHTRWLRGIADERMSELEAAVRASPGYESWMATFKPEFLGPLGEWFAGAVATRSRTSEEMTGLKLSGDLLMSLPDTDLTNHSFSLAIDVEMYLARTFERAYSQPGSNSSTTRNLSTTANQF